VRGGIPLALKPIRPCRCRLCRLSPPGTKIWRCAPAVSATNDGLEQEGFLQNKFDKIVDVTAKRDVKKK